MFVNELITFVIKKHDEGIGFDRIKSVILQQINQTTSEFIKLLSQNQREPQYIWFLGLFYHYGIGTDEDSNKAFELFLKAAEDNYSIAQVYLAKHYYHQVEDDLAFKYYQQSVENPSGIGQFYLGCCYESGIGIGINKLKAFKLYKNSAKRGNNHAQHKLGNLYRKGVGIRKDLERAFHWYGKAANDGNQIAQYKLGKCYQYGREVEKDQVKAFEWLERSAKHN